MLIFQGVEPKNHHSLKSGKSSSNQTSSLWVQQPWIFPGFFSPENERIFPLKINGWFRCISYQNSSLLRGHVIFFGGCNYPTLEWIPKTPFPSLFHFKAWHPFAMGFLGTCINLRHGHNSHSKRHIKKQLDRISVVNSENHEHFVGFLRGGCSRGGGVTGGKIGEP